MPLTIDPEFRALIPPPTADESAELEASILVEGCRDALVTWSGVLLDGHNRYEICQRHNLPYTTVERQFEDRDAAKEWIIRNQFARRSLSTHTRGVLVLRLKDILAEQANRRMLLGTFTPDPNLDRGRTLDKLADVAGMSHGTLHKIEAIEGKAPDVIKQLARSGEMSTHRAYGITRALEDAPQPVIDVVSSYGIDEPETVNTLKRLYASNRQPGSNGTFEEIAASGYIQPGDEEEAVHITDSPLKIQEALHLKSDTHRLLAGDKKRLADHQLIHQSNSVEWYTPAEYIEAARRVMDGIDIDPASNDLANETVRAAVYYTAETNGLDKEWNGRCWMNPPYGSLSGKFVARLLEEFEAGRVTEAIVLCNSHATETDWFAPLWNFKLCFTHHRINFQSPEGGSSGSTHGSVFAYLGPNWRAFAHEFSPFGYIVERIFDDEYSE